MVESKRDPLSGPVLPYGLPDDWPKAERPPSSLFGAAFLALLTIGLLAAAGWVTADGQPGTGFMLIVIAVYFGHLTAAGASRLRYPRHGRSPVLGVDDRGERGLTFAYARAPYYWQSAIVILTALGFAGGALGTAVMGPVGGWIIAAVAGLVAGSLTWFVVDFLRRAPGRVVLTPSGIYHRSHFAEYFTPWDAVSGVGVTTADPMIVVKADPSPDARQRRLSRRRNRSEEDFWPFIVIGAYSLGGNSRPVYRAIDFYLRHRERRSLLGTPEAITAATGTDRLY